ncbi:MAG: zinc dependent phospholipase C family protein [Anaerolineae bacterium]|nr:zinc dependent phospholipase C family protein [Anaerolineae bacterium]
MPTPFMHLRAAHRFLSESPLAEIFRQQVESPNWLGAFLLGNVAPDARVSGGHSREATHFFEYQAHVEPHAGDALLAAYPQLRAEQGAGRAFVAGYLAHLAMDVVWCEDMLFTQFYQRDWGDAASKYLLLHVLLCYLDERDYKQWPIIFYDALHAATPQGWRLFCRTTI